MSLELNINVNIGVTPDTAALLAALRLCKPTASTPAAAAQVLGDIVNNAPASTAPVDPIPPTAEPQPETPETPEAAPAPEAQEQPQTATPTKRNFGVEVREIMHRTRQRIEGADYKENTDGEGYKKYHRALTGQFKVFATTLQVEKPSALDTAEKVDSFAQMCDELYVTEDGKLEIKQAPY